MSRSRAILAIAGLALLVGLPFAARFALERSAKSRVTVDLVSRQMSRGEYAEAYRTLRNLQADAADLTTDERIRLAYQWALCDRYLGRPRQAYQHLQRLKGGLPEIEDYRRLWATRALEQKGNEGDAAAGYEELIASALSPVVADSAHQYLAGIYAQRGDFDKARELYRGLLSRVSNSRTAEVLYRLARLYDAVPDPEAAHETRVDLMQRFPGHRSALDAATLARRPQTAGKAYTIAQVYYRHKQYGRASRRLRSFLSRHPEDERAEEAHYTLAQCYLKSGNRTRARRSFARVYEKYGRPSALYRIGGIQVRGDRDGEAIATYERFLRDHPRHVLADDALWQAAKAAERIDEFERAEYLYKRLADGYGDGPYGEEARWGAGFMAYCKGDYEAAMAAFDALSAAAGQPHIVDQSLYWAGKSAQQLRDQPEASGYYQRAANNFPRSYYSTRAVRLGYGQPQESLALRGHFPSAPNGTRWDPSELPSLIRGADALERGSTLGRLGLNRLAGAELAHVERLNRRDTEALKVLRDHYEHMGILNRALRLSTRIFAAEADSGDIFRLYPNYYWNEVRDAADEAGVDPYLVLSVIRQESFFDEDAVSRAGAVGLMQIMPQTGRVLARAMGVRKFKRSLLFDPDISIRMGSRFLGDQVQSFMEGPTEPAGFELGLAAYNAGPQVAWRWVGRFPYEDADAFIERIPYKETRLYVKKVLKNYTIYKTLSDA